jgi:transcriptional regulator with XRE-family HTH domain
MSLTIFICFVSLLMMSQVKNQMLLKKIASRIKSLREKKEITQEQFYHDTGIHLGRIETGKMNISISTLDTICKYFDVTLEEFFKGI